MAWRNLWRNKSRTAIMIAATLFAVLLAVIMKSTQEGVYELQIKNLVGYHSGYLQIQNPEYDSEKSLDNSLLFDSTLEHKIQNISEVTSYTPRIESFVLAASSETTKGIMLTGSDPSLENNLTGLEKRVIEGSYFTSNSDGIMIGKGLANYMKIGVADTLIFYGSGYHASSAVGKYPIVAILEFGAPQLNDNMAYMPLKASQELFSSPDLVTSVAINIKNRKDLLDVQSSIQSNLDNEAYQVKNWEEMMPELVNQIEGDRSSGAVMLGVLYMIIGFVIYGTLLMMISERLREFSMLVAIGMKNKLLATTLLLECVIMTFIGALLGGLISIPLTTWLQNSPIKLEGSAGKAYEQIGFEPAITAITDIGIISSQTWIVASMSIVLSIYPMIKILKMTALDGMKG